MKVAVVAVVVSVPATAVPPDGVSVRDTEDGAREPAKVTPIVAAKATPAALVAGVVEATLTVLAVVNVELNGAIAVPSLLAAVTATVYEVLPAKAAAGVNVADGAVTARAPGTTAPPGPVSVTDTEEGFNGPENATVTGLVTGTANAPVAGVTDATEGAPTVVVNTTSTK